MRMWLTEVVSDSITLGALRTKANEQFGDFVKGVVDVERRVMAIGAELHADEEAHLLDNGSRQADLWGINLYPAMYGQDDFVEFDSMINIRPSQNNRSRSVEDPRIQALIRTIVAELIVVE